jgi:hypothetical protein
MITAVAQMSALMMLRSTAPIVSARNARRTLGTGDVSSSASPVRCLIREDAVAGLLALQVAHDPANDHARDAHEDVRDEDDHEHAEQRREVVADLRRPLRLRQVVDRRAEPRLLARRTARRDLLQLLGRRGSQQAQVRTTSPRIRWLTTRLEAPGAIETP